MFLVWGQLWQNWPGGEILPNPPLIFVLIGHKARPNRVIVLK